MTNSVVYKDSPLSEYLQEFDSSIPQHDIEGYDRIKKAKKSEYFYSEIENDTTKTRLKILLQISKLYHRISEVFNLQKERLLKRYNKSRLISELISEYFPQDFIEGVNNGGGIKRRVNRNTQYFLSQVDNVKLTAKLAELSTLNLHFGLQNINPIQDKTEKTTPSKDYFGAILLEYFRFFPDMLVLVALVYYLLSTLLFGVILTKIILPLFSYYFTNSSKIIITNSNSYSNNISLISRVIIHIGTFLTENGILVRNTLGDNADYTSIILDTIAKSSGNSCKYTFTTSRTTTIILSMILLAYVTATILNLFTGIVCDLLKSKYMCLSCIKWLDESLKTEKKVNGFIRRALKSTSELQFLVSSNGKTIRALYTEKRGGNVDSSSSHHPILSSLSPSSTRYHTASASVLNENILQLARILQSLITTKLDLINSLLKLASCSPSFANGFSSELKEKCDYVFGDEDGISYESSLLEMYSQFEKLSLTAPDLNNTFSTNTEDCHYDDNYSKIAALKLKFNDYACVSFDFFSFALPNTFLALLRFIMLNDDHGLPSNIIAGNDIYHKSEEDGYNDAGYCLEMYFRALCTYGSSVAQIYRAGTNEYFSTREKNTALTASNGKTNNKDTETSNTTDNYASENYRRVAISQMYSILTTLYAKVNVLSDLVAAKNNHSSEKSSELSSHDSNLEFLSLYKSLGEEIDILSTLHARNQKILEGKYNENNTLSGVYGYGIDGVCGTTSNVNTNSNTTESGSIDPDSLGKSQLDGTENSKYFVDASSSYFTDLLAPLEIYELEEANEKSNEANSEHTQTSLDQNPLFVRSGLSRAERIALAKQKRENQRQRKQRQETCQQNPGHDTAIDQFDQFEPFMFINELKSAILDKTKPY